jgi:hypothetical protein
MRAYKIGIGIVGLVVIVLVLYLLLQILLVFMLSGVIDDGSPLQYANRICPGQAAFSRYPPYQRHTLQWDAAEQKLLVYHNDSEFLIIDPFKPQDNIAAFPRFRGRIADMTGSLLLVRERGGLMNIYDAHNRSPLTAHPIEGLAANSRVSPDGLRIATGKIGVGGAELQSLLLLTQSDRDEWIVEHEVVFRKAIHDIHAWSGDNLLLVATEWAREGIAFRIIDGSTGKVIKESNNTAILCTGQIIWVNNTVGVIYMGSSGGNHSWDLYSERLDSNEVIKLIDTPTIDEVSPAISPDQNRVAYVAKYWNDERRPVQHLFMAGFNASGAFQPPVQLTDKATEFVFNPVWISDSQIIYLVWNGDAERSWEFRVISTETLVSQTVGVFSAPEQSE